MVYCDRVEHEHEIELRLGRNELKKSEAEKQEER